LRALATFDVEARERTLALSWGWTFVQFKNGAAANAAAIATKPQFYRHTWRAIQSLHCHTN
jgi:hypothetical protein